MSGSYTMRIFGFDGGWNTTIPLTAMVGSSCEKIVPAPGPPGANLIPRAGAARQRSTVARLTAGVVTKVPAPVSTRPNPLGSPPGG